MERHLLETGIAGFCGRKERIKGGTERDRVGKMGEKNKRDLRTRWKKWYRKGCEEKLSDM
jgi:hypothetical protein